MTQSVLFITCSAGHGHTIATESIKKRLLQETPDLNIIALDISPYILYPFGGKVNKFWDFNMRHGTRLMSLLPKLLELTHYETFYEKCLSKSLRTKVAGILRENNITTIYDAQPIFTNLSLNTLADTQKDKTCAYHKILTDLPTHLNQHFLPNIKRIKHRDNVSFKLHAQKPIENSSQDFWQQYCSLNAQQLSDTFALPVNEEYLTIPEKLDKITVDIPKPLREYYALDYKDGQLHIPAQTYVTTLMLGSQGLSVIPDYVNAYIQQAKNLCGKPRIFFVACSKNDQLYQKLEEKILQANIHNNLAEHIILPLPMQAPSTIAELMWRSQQVVMRPSGLSCLEQLAMRKTRQQAGQDGEAKIWIHAPYTGTLPETENQQAQDDFLIKHSFGYERGNAEYLLATLDAHLVTPCCIEYV